MKNPVLAHPLRATSLACVAFVSTLSCVSVHAQSATTLPQTVVTATRTAQPLAEVLADVSVLDRTAIDRAGATGLVDLLARLPGVEFGRSGGPAGTTGMFVRGAESRYTAVYVDGVRVDSQATGGATWEAIPLAQIERVELLRGPAAAVYGSDALAGVVQIFTRKGEGAFSPVLGMGLGRYGTRKLDAAASGSQGAVDYSVGLADERSQGFNARPVASQNPDLDGYSRQSGNARLGLKLNAAHRLEATVLVNRLDAQYDSSTARVDEHGHHRLQTAGLSWDAKWSPELSSRVSVNESRTRYESTPAPYLTLTRLRGLTWFNSYRLGAATLTAALERKEDWLDNAPIQKDRSQNALAVGYGLQSTVHSLQLNLRHDRDSEFGTKTTGSAAYGYAITPQWRATASVGNAFRAPTVYQRFSIYGVASLQPESSRNAELGLRYTQGSSQFQAIAYRSRVSNLITFVSGPGTCLAGSGSFPGCFANTAEALYSGVTLSGQHTLGAYQLRGSLDLQNPRDLTLNRQLARRSRQHASMAVDRRVGDWLAGAEWALVGKRYSGAGETLPMGGYGLLNLSATRRFARDWTVLARVDNLADKRYETVSAYATPGRSLYLGLRWAPKD